MVLEATVVCVDNSDFMINGDYKPTRLQAQAEAVNLLAGAKTGSNPENTVGVLSLAGVRGPKVLATPTPDLGRVLSCMQKIKPEGSVSLIQGVQIAQLALKHRQNKNQRQRIVAFIGSPLEEEEKALVKVAKKLKKNNVSIDIVSFGEEAAEKNAEKLDAFLAAVNSNDSSHLVTVPPGTILSDILLSTPVFMGDNDGGSSGMGGMGGGGGGGGASDFEFGVDPNLDPELALALRVSMEEERARQEAQAQREREQQQQDEGGATTAADAPSEGGKAEGSQVPGEVDMKSAEGAGAGKEAEAAASAAEDGKDADGDVEMTDEAILQQALAMSLTTAAAGDPDPTTPAPTKEEEKTPAAPTKTDGAGGSDLGAMLEDQSFVTSVLSNLPGVDVSDANVQQVLSALKEKQSPKRSRTDDGDEDHEKDDK
ncbi:subunit Rpn10 of proteasome [Chloropicon primus]|nr:subunit Rpn10 of proteasome [Chloropicon primus]